MRQSSWVERDHKSKSPTSVRTISWQGSCSFYFALLNIAAKLPKMFWRIVQSEFAALSQYVKLGTTAWLIIIYSMRSNSRCWRAIQAVRGKSS